MRKRKPQDNQLRGLLSNSLYGDEEELGENAQFYTYTDLLNTFQGSEAELKVALRKVKALNIKGKPP